ncbi:MAG: hypothetical protein QOF51_297 [Chloroflexota bacterium]|jgi:hypothetical protein|nr:hypothetical protein [Chloroflexota bacterium]
MTALATFQPDHITAIDAGLVGNAVPSAARVLAVRAQQLAKGRAPGRYRRWAGWHAQAWSDLDLDRGQAAIVQTVQRLVGLGYVFGEPKTAKERRQVALPKTVREVLRRHRITQAEDRLRMGPVWNDCGLVFTNPTGGPMDPSALTRRLRRLL